MYVVKEKKMPEYITDDTEVSSDDSLIDTNNENSDQGNSDEENFNEKT